MKYTKIAYKLSHRRFENEISIHEEDGSFGSLQEGVTISWASHGAISIENAKAFAKALDEAIKTAEGMQ